MKSEVFSLFLASMFFCSISAEKGRIQKPGWKGTIKEEGGVTVVENSKSPVFLPRYFELREELSLGGDPIKEKTVLSQIRDIAVDKEENIYVLDFKEIALKVFNNDGELLRVIGHIGQGPGEFQRIVHVSISADNKIVVNDRGNRKLQIYDTNGKYLKAISIAGIVSASHPRIDKNQDIILRELLILGDGSAAKYSLRKYNQDMRELFSLFSYTSPINMASPHTPYPAECFWGMDDKGNIIWGYSTKYEINICDQNGKIIRKIRKDYTPIRYEDTEKREWIENAFGKGGLPPNMKINWPKYHNAFHSIYVDDPGNILVGTYEKSGMGYYFDIFDKYGIFLGKFPFNKQILCWKKGNIYALEEAEDGAQRIKRYALKCTAPGIGLNWDTYFHHKAF